MAEGIGTALSVANTLFTAINNILQAKEILSTFSYKSDLRRLMGTVSTIQVVLLDADNHNSLKENQQHLIDKLKDAIYDADDLFDKFLTQTKLNQELSLRDGNRFKKVRHLFSSKNPLIVAWSISQGVKNISKILEDTANHFPKPEFSSNYSEPIRRIASEGTISYVRTDNVVIGREDDAREIIASEGTISHVRPDNVVIGRKDDAREIIGRLLNSTDDVGFLSIVGMGGLGKTTLAKLVFSDETIESEFPIRSWICVGDQDQDGSGLDVKKILSSILDTIGLEFEDVNNSTNVQQEFVRNFGGKKFLLVIDDIWTVSPVEWQKLSSFLMMGGKGSRIIATTRLRKTAEMIGNYTHELKGLSSESSWYLFKTMAFGGQSIPPDFVEVSLNILEKCSNIPLAIKVVGRFLFGKTIQAFRLFLEGLDGFAEDKYGHNTMKLLKLSYDHLASSLKTCFSYCALFPKDYVMKKEVVMNLWEAQGYIVPSDESQSMEDAGEECLVTLLQRNFFQDVKTNEYGDVESFKMHDMMHDLAQSISGKEMCVLNSSVPIVDKSVRHLFDSTLIKEDDFIVHSKIRSYLMFRKRWCFEAGFPLSKIAKKQCCLRALALQGLCISSLPDTIGNLLHLRYLNLAKNSMKKLPDSVAKLHNLQTLNINKCDELKEWPKEFSKLVNLKYLYREKCYQLRCMPVGMSKLTRLRVLTDFVVEDESVGGMKHVGQLKDLKVLSLNLKTRLSIQFHVNFTGSGGYDWEGSCLECAEHLKEVEIGFSFPSHVLYQRRMDEEKGVKEELVMTKLQPHPNLKKFMLSNYVGSKITSWGRARDNWAEARYLPNLVHIKFSNCHRLQQLPLLSKLLHLKSLYLFELKNLKFVEEPVITGDSGSSEPRSLDTTFFPSLESLEILELKNLKGWWRSCYSRLHQPAFPRLSQLTIENCPQLTSFPRCLSHPKQDLRNINKRLRITTIEEADTSSSFQPPQPILPCP